MDAGHEKTLIFLDERFPRNPSLCCVINDNFQGKSIYSTANRRALWRNRSSFGIFDRLCENANFLQFRILRVCHGD